MVGSFLTARIPFLLTVDPFDRFGRIGDSSFGVLIVKSGYLPKVLGALLIAASVAYLVGSTTHFLFPARLESVTPVYAVALVAELSVCLWLLTKGVNVERWEKRTGTTSTAGQ